jgi:Domain of unknown function (DUF1707)
MGRMMLFETPSPIRYRCAMARYATLRASDADREAVAERLRRAAVEGRLEPDELEQRLGAALSARTYGQLDGLLADLPSGAVRPRERSRLAVGARSVAAVAVPVAVALVALLALVTVVAIAAAGWMVWMLIWLLVCTGRCSARRRRHVSVRRVHRTRPAGLL